MRLTDDDVERAALAARRGDRTVTLDSGETVSVAELVNEKYADLRSFARRRNPLGPASRVLLDAYRPRRREEE
jgi:hypothetical protein